MEQPHKHSELLHKFADNKDLKFEWLNPNNEWTDVFGSPSWNEFTEYRIKPEVVRYRVALFKDGSTVTADNNLEVKEYETDRLFKKWLTDWIEVEV